MNPYAERDEMSPETRAAYTRHAASESSTDDLILMRAKGMKTTAVWTHCGDKTTDCYPGQWCGCVCSVCEWHAIAHGDARCTCGHGLLRHENNDHTGGACLESGCGCHEYRR